MDRPARGHAGPSPARSAPSRAGPRRWHCVQSRVAADRNSGPPGAAFVQFMPP